MNSTKLYSIDKFSEEADTCFGKNNNYFLEDFFAQFQDSFCYTFVLQFLMVTLMYMNVGKGKYWRILFYAALAGFLGAMVENLTLAYICRDKSTNSSHVLPFLINEIFWIPNEYAIPLLNLIKMKAFSSGRLGTITKYTIVCLSFPFIFFRLCIGYYRMTYGYLQNKQIRAYHGYAFAVMAVADIICTSVLLYMIKKNKSINGSNINDFVKNSSYTILITVDVVSALLSLIDIVSNVGPWKETFPSKLFTLFHCLKCSSILILAVDAFIFKYDANVSSNNGSSGTKNYGTNSNNTYGANYSNMNSSYKSKIVNYSSEMNNSSSKNHNSMIQIAPYNYPSMDMNTTTTTKTKTKSILKNHTMNMDSYEPMVYSHQFGFLNQT